MVYYLLSGLIKKDARTGTTTLPDILPKHLSSQTSYEKLHHLSPVLPLSLSLLSPGASPLSSTVASSGWRKKSMAPRSSSLPRAPHTVLSKTQSQGAWPLAPARLPGHVPT
ncbi:hypothetical protein PICMEDRAFT_147431 [Pichia membranifaciens NRRL Y-2026]|uniref:Uncharacterized protein n=1 Tax=Pichia membranifaciens NRRL Y-2026 TaxID=763406 RepID=A0A1E3NIH0_9ASCO|nr:hypothetical protein PICMEDRAFT_147431 [Pichia membranifaciens NRRL Y-2026]ODQ45945.1 hypothetical protein PICMEDRAFT_147431 [Pichia membranifaciens NRRL Y-2026]